MRAQAAYSNSSKVLSSTFISGDDLRLSSVWRSITFPQKINCEIRRTRFVIKAVATIEPNRLALNGDADLYHRNAKISADSVHSVQSMDRSSEDSADLDESEKLRRMRISRANKGNTPWNKGRKHSLETLQRIREMTKLAMQNPKVKMKLVNLGHAQTEETKLKIGAGVRIGWQKRRARMTAQKKCFFEWQNLISEASRNGCTDEDELQWDSYDIRSKQLEQQRLETFEQCKIIRRQKGNRRAPKSFEQMRKIAAKWTDPLYRGRVYSGKVKFHGIPGAERKPRKKSNSSSESKRRNPKVKATDEGQKLTPMSNPVEPIRLDRIKAPIFKDPLASSKLEMIKSIRARRSAAEIDRFEVLQQASSKLEMIKSIRARRSAAEIDRFEVLTKPSSKLEMIKSIRARRSASEIDRFEVLQQARLLIAEAEKSSKALEVAAIWSSIARASLMKTRKLIAKANLYINSIGDGSFPNSEPDPCHSSSSPLKLTNSMLNQDIERNVNGGSGEKFGLLLKNGLDSIEGETNSSKRAVVTKKWVRGRLVEVAESS